LGSIFVSYRRSDSQGEAGRLFDDLTNHFGENMVFMDVAGIEAGRDFRRAIEQSVAACGVLLVVMGPEWLNAKDETGARRLNDPADFVRIETASALKRDIPVVPVLVRGAVMPRSEQLPEDLRELAYRNSIELTHARWRSDIQLLFEQLRRTVEVTTLTKAEKASSSYIDPASLQQVSRDLALHIGPIAEIVVRRAASHCTSLEDLYLKVSAEIDSLAEREGFLANRGLSSASSEPGVTQETTVGTDASGISAERSDKDENQLKTIQLATGVRTSRRWRYLFLVSGAGILLMLMVVFGAPFARKRGGSPAIVKPSNQPTPSGAALSAGRDTAQPASEASIESDTSARSPIKDASKTASQSSQRVRLPQEVAQSLLITKVLPDYPPLARQARVQGTVVLAADISKNGSVEDLRAISGHPMLIPAAVNAVRKFKYKPYVVNGDPVPVSTQVLVTFTLTGG
jgi:TonB family protein